MYVYVTICTSFYENYANLEVKHDVLYKGLKSLGKISSDTNLCLLITRSETFPTTSVAERNICYQVKLNVMILTLFLFRKSYAETVATFEKLKRIQHQLKADPGKKSLILAQ